MLPPNIEIEIKNLKIKIEFREDRVKSHIELRFVSGLDRETILKDTAQVTQLSLEDAFRANEFKIVNKNGKKGDKDDDHDDDKDDDKDDDDDDDKDDDDKDKKNKKEIEVEIDLDDGESEIEIKWNGKKIEFDMKTTDKDEILNEIAKRLDLRVEEIRPYVEFEIDD